VFPVADDAAEQAENGARRDGGLLASGVVGTAASTEPAVTADDLPKLEKQFTKQKKTLRKTKKKARRIARTKRAKVRGLAVIKRQRSATIARRESAEAGLASRILSMSRLAQRRVAKKTNIRPGVNSGFAWPTRGRISQGYGCTGYYLNPPRGSCRHFHDGLDITGYRGTPIRSAAIGVVSYVGWNPWDQEGRAFMIVVAHPGGYETLYGHVLSTRRVRVGQLVKKGQLIGNMGNTGRSTGVHLHFELRRGRTTLNPLAFL
jgi:murein DD-endopeptidase MepM/ murein hydrolase activator NlpD